MHQYLLASDFDGTVALTFEKSPKGIGVDEAYKMTVHELFGDKGLNSYRKIGGHKNRPPTKLVQLIINKTSEDLVEKLVSVKLGHLLGEIGTCYSDGSIWPRPAEGFLDCWGQIERMNTSSDFHLCTAIISNGHEAFIRKTFDAWDVLQPDFLVTEDDIRPRKFPQESSRRFKPGQLPLALIHKAWMNKQNFSDRGEPVTQKALETRKKIIYFGDDSEKDGGLARKPGVVFGHFINGFNGITYRDGVFTFGNWNHIADLLHEQVESLKEGRPFLEIASRSGRETMRGCNKERT